MTNEAILARIDQLNKKIEPVLSAQSRGHYCGPGTAQWVSQLIEERDLLKEMFLKEV